MKAVIYQFFSVVTTERSYNTGYIMKTDLSFVPVRGMYLAKGDLTMKVDRVLYDIDSDILSVHLAPLMSNKISELNKLEKYGFIKED